ncbi:MAG TPA: D-alanine--D-alanine ligase family protein [Bryobacteraceae bacterium]|jgi:D-alanine-D-alanine ligase|nr:D-alanine--D-alanine ligase family protein [Bryobacteraceae bacterium]
MTKTRVAILFGGRSAEHEVSIRSAHNVANALDREKYDVLFIGITREGKWLVDCPPKMLASCEPQAAIETAASSVDTRGLPREFAALRARSHSAELPPGIDVLFPVLHGPYGEDGSVQGLAKVVGIPCVGAGVLGSALGMDKDVMKRLLRESRIPTPHFLVERRYSQHTKSYAEVVDVLGAPFFIKPANLGSSVGVCKVTSNSDYDEALAEAFQFDNKVLLEECIVGREIECAVLGNEEPIASVPGEVIVESEFYSYDAKYVDADASRLEIPANLNSSTTQAIQRLAIETFNALCCEGMARVDFFLCETGTILVNEINTIPGFTDISMFPKLWESSGIPLSQILEKLINFAMQRFQREQSLRTSVSAD